MENIKIRDRNRDSEYSIRFIYLDFLKAHPGHKNAPIPNFEYIYSWFMNKYGVK